MELPILTNTTWCAPSTGCCERSYPVAILGAGPIGLAAAAHLKAYNIPFIILEKGDAAANVASWAHVQLFSPWEYNVDAAAQKLLESTDWKMPNKDDIPTGQALRENYLLPLSKLFKEQLRIYREAFKQR